MIGEKQKKVTRLVSELTKTGGKKVIKSSFFRRLLKEKQLEKYKKSAICAVHFAVGFFLGAIEILGGVGVCGAAYVISVKKYAFFAYLGSSFAALTKGADGGAFFVLGSIGMIARSYISSGRFDEKRILRLVTALGLGVLTFVLCMVSGQPVSTCFWSFAVVPALSFCIMYSRTDGELAITKSREWNTVLSNAVTNVATCGLAFFVIFALVGKSFFVLLPSLFISCIVTMSAAYSGGMFSGGFFGLMCGIAMGDAHLMLSQGIAGFLCGIFRKKSPVLFFPLFFFPASAVIYFAGYSDFYEKNATLVLSMVMFLLIYRKLPLAHETDEALPYSDKTDRQLMKLSGALSSLSAVFRNVSDKLRYPHKTELYELANAIFDKNCKTCKSYKLCFSGKSIDGETVEDIVVKRLMSGGVKKSDLPDGFGEGCEKLSSIVDGLNTGYHEMISEYFNNNKTEILASEYSAMARMLKYTSQKTKTDTVPDKKLYEKAFDALCAIGLRFSTVSAYGKRIKVIEVADVRLEGFPCTAAELSDYLSEKCGVLFGEPEFVIKGKGRIMRLTQKRRLRLEYARAVCAKGAEEVCGDTVSFFENDEDYFYALISDGMGSGRSAALTSRLTSVFMEKLLTTGAHKNVTLELLNNLLLSKNDESFATVDLLEIDLLSGEACFVKAGAAPAYIVRASKLYKIASKTPPAGIIGSFGAESTKFNLCDNDVVLMLSDGILQSNDEIPWLCEMLTFDNEENVSKLANKILAKAKKINIREDDMTCVALKVHELQSSNTSLS